MSAKQISSALAQLFFPQRHCLLCGYLTGGPGLCADCAAKQRALKQCDICATFVDENGICCHCAARRPLFTQARAALPYGGEIRNSLRCFKYREQTWLRRPLADLLAKTYQRHYAQIRFDAVIAVPLAPRRLKERGYNQSELLSRNLAGQMQLPHSPQLLKRVQDTPPLATYSGPQRSALLKQAFAAAGPAEGKTLLVVDDIYTSGATLAACAAVLLAAGAREVYGLTVAGFDARTQSSNF